MTLYVLDTDHVTLHQRNNPVLIARLASHRAEDLVVSMVTVEEQLRGWLKLIRRAKTTERLVSAYQGLGAALDYFSSVQLLDFDSETATRYEELRKQGIRVGTKDLQIAATVLRADGVLLSRNRKDFSRVPGLAIDDWSIYPS